MEMKEAYMLYSFLPNDERKQTCAISFGNKPNAIIIHKQSDETVVLDFGEQQVKYDIEKLRSLAMYLLEAHCTLSPQYKNKNVEIKIQINEHYD